jgi:hypothetical protein
MILPHVGTISRLIRDGISRGGDDSLPDSNNKDARRRAKFRDYIVENETYLRNKEANAVRTNESETKGWQLRHDNDSTRRKTSQLLGHATKQQP